MSKKVVLVASLLVAAGAAAAVSAPSLRGQRHGSLLEDIAAGFGRATQQVSQAVGIADEDAAPSREERRSRRGKQRRGAEDRSVDTQAVDREEDKQPREARGNGSRGKDRLARQDDDDDGNASQARRERRWAEHDRGARDEDEVEPRRRGSLAGSERSGQYFSRMDKNGDGAIDMSEFVLAETERITARARQFFKRFDADGDGKVTREEFGRASRERSAALDSDDEAKATDGEPQGGRGKAVAK
jgi:hypothetical protein